MPEQGTPNQVEATNFPTLESWCDFVKQDWLFPLGSDRAHAHFRAKLDEKQRELRTALATGEPDAIATESGDVAFCAVALTLNCGFSLTDALGDSTIGAIDSTSQLDELAQQGLEYWDVPIYKALWGLSDETVVARMRDIDTATLVGVIGELAHTVCVSAEIYRNLSQTIQTEEYDSYWDIYLHESRIKEAVGELIVSVGVAARLSGTTLGQILQSTQAKLLARKTSGQPITRTPQSRSRR